MSEQGQIVIEPEDPEIKWILSLMIFTTGPSADDLRKGGLCIKRRAEEEQCEVFIWLLRQYKQHGPGWRGKAEAELKAGREKWEAQAAIYESAEPLTDGPMPMCPKCGKSHLEAHCWEERHPTGSNAVSGQCPKCGRQVLLQCTDGRIICSRCGQYK